MKRIKIGQIGVCHEHASKIATLREMRDVFEVVGVVDDRASPSAKFAGSDLTPFEGLAWMTEDELLKYPGLQAVAVETANGDLVPTATRCMNQGLSIHMDKPGGENITEFRELIHGCREKKLPFQMGYMFRNNPAMQFCQKVVRKNWLGDIFEVQTGMSHNYGGEAYQNYLGNFQGGLMFNLGCHLIDLIVAILGRPGNIIPILKTTPGFGHHIKNNCLSILEYQGATAVVRACSQEVDGLNNRRLKICGTKGTIDLCPLERFDGKPLTMCLTLLEGNGEYPSGTHTLSFGIQTDRYHGQFLDFAKIISGDIPNPYDYEHEMLVQEVVLAASGYSKWE